MFSEQIGDLYVQLGIKDAGSVTQALANVQAGLQKNIQMAHAYTAALAGGKAAGIFSAQAAVATMTAQAAAVEARQRVAYQASGAGQAALAQQSEAAMRVAALRAQLITQETRASTHAMMGGDGASLTQSRMQLGLAQGQGRLAELTQQNQFTASPQGAAYLAQQVATNRAINQAQNVASWRQLVAEQGRYGVGLLMVQSRLDGAQRTLHAIASASPMSFGGATSWITSMAGAASPAHMATLQGSFHLLSAVVGTEFLPIITRASYALQYSAYLFRNLSPTVRSTAAMFVVGGTALLGFVAVVSTTISMVRNLVVALQALRAFGGVFNIGLSLAGGAAAQTAAGAAGQVAGQTASTLGGAAAGSVGAGSAGGTVGTAVGGGLATAAPAAAAIPWIVGLSDVISNAVQMIHSGDVLGYNVHPNASPETRLRAELNAISSTLPIGSLFSNFATAGRNAQVNSQNQTPAYGLGGVLGRWWYGGPSSAPGAAGRSSLEGGGDSGGDGFQFRPGFNFRSESFGIEQAWMRMQRQAASISPLEAEILRVQIANQQELVQQIGQSVGQSVAGTTSLQGQM